jgi:hypothetical protein
VCAAFGGGGAFARSRDFALARENADFSNVSAMSWLPHLLLQLRMLLTSLNYIPVNMSRITMTMSCHRLCLTALLLLLFHGRAATAFSSNRVNHAIEHSPKRSNISLQMTTPSDNINDRLDVVVFGVGDLRVDDHGGLQEAMRHSSYKNVQPVVLLDPTILECIPGATCYTYDTAYMLHSALKDLERSLYSQFGLDLQVVSSVDEILSNHQSSDLHVHVCNLGPADNGMGYSPYSVLYDKHNTHDNVQIHAWTCRLREEPWSYLETLTDLYPKYKQKYVDKQDAQLPSKIMVEHHNSEKSTFTSSIPSIETLIKLISPDDDNQENDFQSQANTGLYATHWGGLDPATVVESTVLKVLTEYTETCKEVDAAWTPPVARRNPYSLEHAAIEWQSPDNLIAGEYMTRFLAAPLFWGTISPRRIWHASTLNFKFQPSVLKTLVETKEWHALLAARNILVDEQYSNDNDNGLKYKYWKWHGFLCRYAEYRHDNKNAPNKKEVLLLIHGFGASGSQWKGTMEALQHSNIVMAPDLIGFGQSEKPPLSYTQYLWESYILAFGKEIGKDWESFVVGGNSIGGYTAMAVAASDVAVAGKDVSSSGATGSNKCSGVVLMNSAGQILSREDIADTDGSSTVAKITSADALPKCR